MKGRKRNSLAKRQPDGSIYTPRSETAREATRTAVEARQRLFGVRHSEATDWRSGSVLGRLALNNQISMDLYGVGVRYAETRARWLALIDAQGRPRDPDDGQRTPCGECGADVRCDPCVERWAERVRAQWFEAKGALTPWEQAVMAQMVCSDLDMPAQVGTLRQALTALWMLWGQPQWTVDEARRAG